MTALIPLTALQLDKVMAAAEKRADSEEAIVARLRQDPDKAHFAWRFENAAMWWGNLRGALAFGEDVLDADQRFAVGYLVSELKIKRRKAVSEA